MPTSVHTSRYQLFAASAVAALWLTACGGGGGGGDVAAAPPPGGQAGAPAPAPGPGAAPAPAPAPGVATVQLTASAVAQSNHQYEVNAAGGGTIDLTLPALPAVGDTVSITGVSADTWRLVPNAGQSVVTSNLSGVAWTARLDPRVWHWISSDAAGDVLVAGEGIGGLLNTSTDGGATWTAGNSATISGGPWVSSDMTPTGDRIVAVQFNGGIFTSTDHGVTWAPLGGTAPAGVDMTNQSYESVTISQTDNGRHIVAVAHADPADPSGATGAPILVSADTGGTWTKATLVGGGALTGHWRAVDSSADGTHLIAADQDGPVYVSSDSGATWSEVTVTAPDGTAATDNWYRVKMSDDGLTIALVGNSFGGISAGNGIYISRDGGTTWTRNTELVADYTAVAMSGNGQVITVSVSNPNPNPDPGTVARAASGSVLRSTDGGLNFSPLTMPGADTDWRAVATSADGNKIAAATGLFFPATTGLLYTSPGDSTSGAITGGQSMSMQVQYLGNGQWSVPASTGGPFTIQ